MENQVPNPANSGETRRKFIKKAGTAAAVVASSNIITTPVYGQNQAPSTGRVIGANDRINVGYIGVGGQGQAHVRSMKGHAGESNLEQVAVCDVSKSRMNQAPRSSARKSQATKITANCSSGKTSMRSVSQRSITGTLHVPLMPWKPDDTSMSKNQ
jgi:hypothetical protein